jgi:hypothetical protein
MRQIASMWLIIVAFLAVQSRYQRLITVSGGEGWDGHVYADMARRLDFRTEPETFRHRILLPYIVHYLPLGNDTVAKFRMVNLPIVALFMYFLYRLLVSLTHSVRAAGVAWALVVTSELSPARMVFLYPVLTDYLNLTLTVLLFWCAVRLRENALGWSRSLRFGFAFACVLFCGTLNRENFPTNLLLLLVAICSFREGRIWLSVSVRILVVALAALAGVTGALLLIIHVVGSNPFWTDQAQLLRMLPKQNFLRIVVSIIEVYGTFLLLPLGSRGVPKGDVQYVCLLLLGITVAVSLGGIGNIERYLYWGIAFMAVWSLPYLEDILQHGRYVQLGFLCLFHALFQRVFFPIFAGGHGVHGLNSDYDLVEVFSGKSPMMAHWALCATPAMLLRVSYVFLAAAVIFLLLDTRCRWRGQTGELK